MGRQPMKDQVYQVFARARRGDVMHEVGTVQATNDKLARVYAQTVFDEETFLDMFVVPRQAITWVHRIQPLAPNKEARLEERLS